MNTILRPSFRLSKPIIGLRRPPLAQPALYTAILLHSRTIANHVGPGSTSLKHAAQNIKEEAGNSAADLAKRIAGANVTSDAVVPEKKTFVSPGATPLTRGECNEHIPPFSRSLE